MGASRIADPEVCDTLQSGEPLVGSRSGPKCHKDNSLAVNSIQSTVPRDPHSPQTSATPKLMDIEVGGASQGIPGERLKCGFELALYRSRQFQKFAAS